MHHPPPLRQHAWASGSALVRPMAEQCGNRSERGATQVRQEGEGGRGKILLLVRNPKDVAASFFHFSKTFAPFPPYETFGPFFEALMKGEVPWGSYIDFLCVWNKYIDEENVMLITYEELKQNTALGAKKIAKFFELNLNEEDIQGVAERSTFQTMKDNSKKTHGEFGDVLFRKGGVSDWKTLFSQEHNQEMDMAFKERLAGTKVGEMIKYDVYCKA